MITGFRWSAHGAQAVYDVRPDLSCWGKAMGNGFPVSALAGKREFMELGGLRTDRERVFLLSTTHGPETGSLAAFRAVVKTYTNDDPIGRMERAGQLLVEGVEAAVRDEGLADYVQLTGRTSCLIFITRDSDKNPSQAYRTLFLQELLPAGGAGSVVRHLSGPHRSRHRAHRRRGVRRAAPLSARNRAGLGRRTSRGPPGCAGDPPIRGATNARGTAVAHTLTP